MHSKGGRCRQMYQDYKDLLSAFHAHGVRYLIVGGYAVIFHAQPRFTKDIDLFIGAPGERPGYLRRSGLVWRTTGRHSPGGIRRSRQLLSLWTRSAGLRHRSEEHTSELQSL